MVIEVREVVARNDDEQRDERIWRHSVLAKYYMCVRASQESVTTSAFSFLRSHFPSWEQRTARKNMRSQRCVAKIRSVSSSQEAIPIQSNQSTD
jgi:hypothetical protein